MVLSSANEMISSDLLSTIWEYLIPSTLSIRFLEEEVRVHRQDAPILDIASDGEDIYVLSQRSDKILIVTPWGAHETPSLGGIIIAITAAELMVGRIFALREDAAIIEVESSTQAIKIIHKASRMGSVQTHCRHFAVVEGMEALAWLTCSESIEVVDISDGVSWRSTTLDLPRKSQFGGVFAVTAGRSENEVIIFIVERQMTIRRYRANVLDNTISKLGCLSLQWNSKIEDIFSLQMVTIDGKPMLVLGALGRVVVVDVEEEKISAIWDNHRCFSCCHLVKYDVSGKFLFFSCVNSKLYHKVYKQKIVTNVIEKGKEMNERSKA